MDRNVIDNFTGDYAYLSNFYPCPVTYDGITYANAEAAFQAQKCINTKDRTAFAHLAPGKAKTLGRRIPLRPDWEDVKLDVMLGVVRAKFIPSKSLSAALIATGNARLIEGNTWNDTFWGVCRGRGRNELGKILMKVREQLH